MPERSIPLASGLLPIALGEATKTVSFAMDGRKIYRFTVKWGEERRPTIREGPVTATSDSRPAHAAIEAILGQFRGEIMQVPPAFSAIKVQASGPMTWRGRARQLTLRQGRFSSNGSTSSTVRTPIMRFSRPNAARAPISGRSPATWGGRCGASAMSRCSGG